jgi:RNA-directed DNA polymerase
MYEDLMEQALKRGAVEAALKAVVQNKGAPGIDGMPVSELREHVGKHWIGIRTKLLRGSYTPSPVKAVEIEKPGGGTRVLGVPTALDRFVQQLLLQALTPIFDPMFSENSYGFRPKRGARQAVRAAREFARGGKPIVVDLDIAKFFDQVNHDILMTKIGKVIRDKRILRLIGRFLRAGILKEGVVIARAEKGTPQGGPLSPLLGNIYLDALDKELERRGHSFSRYADDCNIYVGSEAAAKRVLESITKWVEQELRLQVNVEKSGVGPTWERQFLGFTITKTFEIRVSDRALERLRARVRYMWDARGSLSSKQLRDQWRDYMVGWWNYFNLAEDQEALKRLVGWIRRHIRKCFWLRWHKAIGRYQALRCLGIKGSCLGIAYSARGAWRIARSPALHQALGNAILRKFGFLIPWELAD